MSKAKILFEKAEAAAAQKEYVPSADYYLEAYALFPSSDFIFNAASMYHLANEKALARKYFEQYLSVDPKGRGASEATSALALYDAARKKEEEKSLKTKQQSDEEARKQQEKDKADAEAAKGQGQLGASNASNRPSVLPPLIGVTTGGLLVGVGIYFGLDSRSISKEVSKSPNFDPELEKQGEDAERNAYIFAGVGTAVIVGSAIYYVVRRGDKSSESKLSLVPAISGDSFGAFATGQF